VAESYRVRIPAAVELDFDCAGVQEYESEWHVFFDSYAEAEQCALRFDSVVEIVADENWSAALQAEWVPIPIGKRFWLAPATWDAATPAGRIRLDMVPGNVFGGGDHPTTQLCLELMEDAIFNGARVADIGTGTGILTRAARALGANAVACDIDPAASVDFIGSANALRTGAFDVVIANIHLAVLREIAPDLRRLGRTLLLSGFLPEQTAEVTGLFGPPRELRTRDGWCVGLWS
jgi:ribosomal protein L11 methyltransferase